MVTKNLGQFTLDQVLDASQDNLNSMSFVTIAFLKENNLSPIDLWHFTGKRFAQQWELGMDAMQVAEGAAINWISAGAKLVEISGDPTRGTVVLSGWPPVKVMEKYIVQPEDAEKMLEIMRPIAERLGFDYEWKREDERIIQIYTKKGQ
jgi:hypothetical protein